MKFVYFLVGLLAMPFCIAWCIGRMFFEIFEDEGRILWQRLKK